MHAGWVVFLSEGAWGQTSLTHLSPPSIHTFPPALISFTLTHCCPSPHFTSKYSLQKRLIEIEFLFLFLSPLGELPGAIRAENLCDLSTVQLWHLIVPDSLEKGNLTAHYLYIYLSVLSEMWLSLASIKT